MTKFVEDINCRDQSILGTVTDHTQYYTAQDDLPQDGFVRTNQGRLEYYDAGIGCWLPFSGQSVNLEIAPHYVQVLEWAMQKMLEEQELDQLTQEYPALEKAKQNLDLIKKMVLAGETND